MEYRLALLPGVRVHVLVLGPIALLGPLHGDLGPAGLFGSGLHVGDLRLCLGLLLNRSLLYGFGRLLELGLYWLLLLHGLLRLHLHGFDYPDGLLLANALRYGGLQDNRAVLGNGNLCLLKSSNRHHGLRGHQGCGQLTALLCRLLLLGAFLLRLLRGLIFLRLFLGAAVPLLGLALLHKHLLELLACALRARGIRLWQLCQVPGKGRE